MDMNYRMITPSELAAAQCWLPALFCGQAGRVARLATHSRRIGDVAGQCLEGWRVSPDPESLLFDELADDSPRYRQANIGIFSLIIENEHCRRPVVEGRPYCVLPGDVVIPRIPPLRASLVSESNHRHPIDGNCFLTRGMKPVDGAWLLALLNEKEYEAWFTARSGSSFLPRIGLRDLRNCPFPDPPEEIGAWSSRLHDWVDRFAHNAYRMFAFRSAVADAVAGFLADRDQEERRLFPGVRMPAEFLSNESWHPDHVENEYRQRNFQQSGWVRMGDLVSRSSPGSARLRDASFSSIRPLMFKDVADLFLPSVDPLLPETRLGRFFADPVQPGETLVSSLVTSPKIVYADPTLSEKVHPIDHWLRLTFRETPGAWALVLATPYMASQFRQRAMGSAQQFTTAARMMDMRFPNVDAVYRKQWQNRLDDLLGERRRLETEWRALRLEGRRMVAEVLDIPWSEMKDRSLK